MEIQDIKNQISGIDMTIADLFIKRMHLLRRMMEQNGGRPEQDKTWERKNTSLMCAEGAPEEEAYLKNLSIEMNSLCSSYQLGSMAVKSNIPQEIERALSETPKQFPRRAKVACQGVEGAYAQMACCKMFSVPEIKYYKSWEEVFQAVESGECEYGVLPIENSTAGSVHAVYDLMKQHQFHIVRGVKLRVQHKLLAKPGTRFEQIREIISHEQALNQCSEFFRAHPEIKPKACANTALAAQMVADSDRTDIAAISSQGCADLYQLNIILNDLQNNPNNYTRFICISKKLEIYPGASRTSLMLSIRHQPGTLNSVLSQFASREMNLTKLESRPLPGTEFEFMFYFDVDASIHSPETVEMIAALDGQLEHFIYLGSYTELA